MNTDDYFYELRLEPTQIDAVRHIYNEYIQYQSTPSTGWNTLHNNVTGLTDILQKNDILSDLVPFLSDTGIELSTLPLSSSRIHIDQIVPTNDHTVLRKSIRNIAINFPIRMCHSVTSFYDNPPLTYTTGVNSIAQYLTVPYPICSFHMGEQAVLFNTRVFHSVKNLSSTETRTILSFSFDIKYSMFDCIEIMKRLGYAE